MKNEIEKFKRDNEKLRKTINGLEETWGLIVGFLVKGTVTNCGENADEVIKSSMLDCGLYIGKKYIEKNSITERGIEAFSKYFYNISDVDVFDIDVLEKTEKKFVIKTSNCPYLKYWKNIGIDKAVPAFCDYTTSADLGIAQAFDPNIKFKLIKNMLKGNDCCIYSFEIE